MQLESRSLMDFVVSRTLCLCVLFCKASTLAINSKLYDLFITLCSQMKMKVTTKCQIGFWGHFLKVGWHIDRPSHHWREMWYLANNLSQFTGDCIVLIIVVKSIPKVLHEIYMHTNLCMCTASHTYSIVYTCAL